MFSSVNKRFLSSTAQALAKFKIYPSENAVRNRALVEAMAESEDGTAIFAWHPKKDFPHEFTQPLPARLEQKNKSLLVEESIEAAKNAFKMNNTKPEFIRAELSRLTFTQKHRWFPRSRDKKMNFKKTPMDRKYL